MISSNKPFVVALLLAAHAVVQGSAFVLTPTKAGVIGTSSSSRTRTSGQNSDATTIGLAPPMSPTTVLSSSSSEVSSLESESSATASLRAEQERQAWIESSVNYYSKVMREERRRTIGQLKDYDTQEYQEEFLLLAKKHYFAIHKVRNGKWQQAEFLYRKIIADLLAEDEHQCDHAKLAVTTLLLALLTKRMKDPKKTRSVFLNFFKLAVLEREEGTECACSAKVLQAYALFEMQQGNSLKSLEIVQKALQFDSTLAPILQWKQFREVATRRGGIGADPIAI